MDIRTFIKTMLIIGKLNYNGYKLKVNDLFLRFNDRAFAVDAVDPAFPRSTAYWWFGCKEAPKGTIGSKRWGALTNEESGPDPNENEFTGTYTSLLLLNHL